MIFRADEAAGLQHAATSTSRSSPLRWYYHCDRLGMLVWQDMPYPAASGYNLLTISAPLITGVHLRTAITGFCPTDAEGARGLTRGLAELVRAAAELPVHCLVELPFNEGWGTV